jgi:ABC-type amino acid transport substrate-binding protein
MNDAGQYSGLSIFLWHHIAEELGFEYSIEQYRFKEMLEAVIQGKADVAVSCLSITQERKKNIDEKLNQALLSVRETPEWNMELVKHIGK